MDGSHLPMLLIIGAVLLAGSLGARLFQRLHIPQVVGYIVVGVLVGKSGLHLIGDAEIERLLPFNFFALGMIGFVIGGELHLNVFKKHGRQFLQVLLAESFGAFLLVAPLVTLVMYVITGNFAISLSLGLVLGAISSATAPAATVDVLWEYKTRGLLTTTVLALVALDDALALILYSLAASIATYLVGGGDSSLWGGLLHTAYELGSAVVMGGLAGVALNYFLRHLHDQGKTLSVIVGVLAVVLGLSRLLETDVILASMALGMTLTNLAPHRSRDSFGIIEKFSPPIYTLFFVFVGARLSVAGMPSWMWWVAVTYLVGRTAGKIFGARVGAIWAGFGPTIYKNLGFCLFSQAGVAIGLAILASMRFEEVFIGETPLGTAIILIVTATTFVLQMIGPSSVKMAVTRAGETGMNVTEEDLLESYHVKDVMDSNVPAFKADALVSNVFRSIAYSNAMSFCVLDKNDAVIGIVTMEELKQCLADTDVAGWVVVFDVMRPAPDKIIPEMPLPQAIEEMRLSTLDAMPVVADDETGRYIGMLEMRSVSRKVTQEVLRRHQVADAGHSHA